MKIPLVGLEGDWLVVSSWLVSAWFIEKVLTVNTIKIKWQHLSIQKNDSFLCNSQINTSTLIGSILLHNTQAISD